MPLFVCNISISNSKQVTKNNKVMHTHVEWTNIVNVLVRLYCNAWLGHENDIKELNEYNRFRFSATLDHNSENNQIVD